MDLEKKVKILENTLMSLIKLLDDTNVISPSDFCDLKDMLNNKIK